jgi:hypothetical protein
MNQEFDRADGRRLYEAPRLTTISLRPEEAVLGHCKTSGTGGPVQPTCTFVTTCQLPGS